MDHRTQVVASSSLHVHRLWIVPSLRDEGCPCTHTHTHLSGEPSGGEQRCLWDGSDMGHTFPHAQTSHVVSGKKPGQWYRKAGPP